MKNIILLIAVGFTLAGCSTDSRYAEEQAKIRRCTDTGGIPIRSTWDSRLADCIYPPQQP